LIHLTNHYSIRMNDLKWTTVYASVIGNLHIRENLPCQDACAIKDLGQGWGIAALADGAGAYEHSDKGARQVVNLAVQHFANEVHRNSWIEKQILPTEEAWTTIAVHTLKTIKEDLSVFSRQNNMTLESLSCTIIVLIYSPLGVLLTHIGDGRAGYLDAREEWHELMTPFRGEEANQTIFITSDFEEDITNKVESRIVEDAILAFCLLSDGCEKSAFECNLFDKQKNIYYDPNRPYPKFFDPNINAIKALEKQNKTQQEMNELWHSFLEVGNAQLRNENDDKTLILGVKTSFKECEPCIES
jgi:hypothetical protein